MASMSTEPPFGRAGRDDSSDDDGEDVMDVRRRVSRFAVDGDSGAGGASEVARRRVSRFAAEEAGGVQQDRRRGAVEDVRPLPPPHAWLAVEETKSKKGGGSYGSENEEQWARLLQRGGSAQAEAAEAAQQKQQPRRSSFSVVRRERGAREAWLDRAWEMKRSWHERNGGAPDADTPVVVVVGTKQQHGHGGSGTSSPPAAPWWRCGDEQDRHGHGAAGGVAMNMEEVRACRDLGLELPSDCSVEIQCYGISAGTSPTHSGSGSGSPSTDGSCSISSPSAGEDPVDVKARLKVWAQAVALASTTTTHLGS